MPDPIPQLDRLASAGKDVPMLTPVEVRRLGSRRRKGRQIATGIGAAVVAVAIGFGVAQSPLFDRNAEPDWATTPTSTATTALPSPSTSPDPIEPTPTTTGAPSPTAQAAPPPTWDNVPVADDVIEAGYGETKGQFEGKGQSAIGLCDPGDWGSPGTVLVREFGSAGDHPVDTWAVVLGYRSVADATAGFDLIQEAAVSCADRLEASGLVDPRITDASAEVPFEPSSVEAKPVRVGYSSGAGLIADDPFQMGRWTQTTVVQAGERVVWMTNHFDGMDFNCVVAPEPDMQQCPLTASVPDVLTRLVH